MQDPAVVAVMHLYTKVIEDVVQHTRTMLLRGTDMFDPEQVAKVERRVMQLRKLWEHKLDERKTLPQAVGVALPIPLLPWGTNVRRKRKVDESWTLAEVSAPLPIPGVNNTTSSSNELDPALAAQFSLGSNCDDDDDDDNDDDDHVLMHSGVLPMDNLSSLEYDMSVTQAVRAALLADDTTLHVPLASPQPQLDFSSVQLVDMDCSGCSSARSSASSLSSSSLCVVQPPPFPTCIVSAMPFVIGQYDGAADDDNNNNNNNNTQPAKKRPCKLGEHFHFGVGAAARLLLSESKTVACGDSSGPSCMTMDDDDSSAYVPPAREMRNLALCTYSSVRHFSGTWKIRAKNLIVVADGRELYLPSVQMVLDFCGVPAGAAA